MSEPIPSLIIGLGRIGQQVVASLKGQLLMFYQGQLPVEVRLVSIDDGVPLEIQAGKGGQGEFLWPAAALQEPGEYIRLGDDWPSFVSHPAGCDWPSEISSWFSVELVSAVAGSSGKERGQGITLRPIGRLMLFHDLRESASSRVIGLVRDACSYVRDQARTKSLQIFLIAPLSDGVGSGIFLDVAYLVRCLAHDERLGVSLKGYLVLPSAAPSVDQTEIQAAQHARAFAALRELRRLTIHTDYERGYRFEYGLTDQAAWQTQLKIPLFDFVYLFNRCFDRSQPQRVGDDWELASLMADTIQGFIDPACGQQINQHKLNLPSVLGERIRFEQLEPDATAFGALGAFTVTLPIHHLIAGWSACLGKEFLDGLLCPAEFSRTGVPSRLKADANQEMPGWHGEQEVDRFLNLSQVVDPAAPERTIQTSQWLAFLALMSQPLMPDGQETAYVLGQWRWSQWREVLEPDGLPDSEGIGDQFSEAFLIQINDRSKSKALSQDKTVRRHIDNIILEVAHYKDVFLGIRDARSAKRAGGQCAELLTGYARIHLDRFRQALAWYVLSLLNGRTAADAATSRNGKLGYVQAFLSALKSRLDNADQIWSEVKRGRGAKKDQLQDMESLIAHRRTEWERSATTTGWRRLLAGAARAESRYLSAEQHLIDHWRSQALDRTIEQLLFDTSQYVQDWLAQVEKWIKALAWAGDGLYAGVLGRQQAIERARRAAEAMPACWTIGGPEYERACYEFYIQRPSNRLLRLWGDLSWQLQTGTETPSLDLIWLDSSGTALPVRFQPQPTPENLALLLDRCRLVFQGALERESVLRWMMDICPDPQELANRFHRRSDVALDHDARDTIHAYYLLVSRPQTTAEQNYLDTWLKHLDQLQGQRAGFRDTPQQFANLAPSSDRFHCRLIHTQELIPLTALRTNREQSLLAYWSYGGEGTLRNLDRRALHVLPGEVYAVRFEDRLESLGQPRRALDDQIIVQLEQVERCRLFLMAYVFGLIVSQVRGLTSDAHTVWLLDLAQPFGPQAVWFLTRSNQTQSLFDALVTFNMVEQDQHSKDVYHPIDYQQVRDAVQTAREDDARQRLQNDDWAQTCRRAWPLVWDLEKHLPRAFERARAAIAQIDRLAEARNEMQKASNALAGGQGYEAQRDRDLLSVFMLMLQDEIDHLKHTVNEQTRVLWEQPRSPQPGRGRW